LHIAGMDRTALQAAVRAEGDGLEWREVEPRLEDVFIHMLSVEEARR
jgi:ABC-2 type transport system ATP-binding protein